MAMRVCVSVVNVCSVEMIPATEFAVSPSDQILAVKGRISDALALPFSEVDLLKAGCALRDVASVEECGIEDNAALILKVSATDAVLVSQLEDLISDRSLTVDEVGMLYVYTFGVPVGDALAALGHGGMKLQDFLSCQKVFQMADGRVQAVAMRVPSAGLAPVAKDEIVVVEEDVPQGNGQLELSLCVRVQAGAKAVEEMTDICIPIGITVKQAKAYIAQSEMIPYAIRSLELRGGGALLDDGAALADCRVGLGSTLDVLVQASENHLSAQLEDLLRVRGAMSTDEMSIQYCYQHGVSVARSLKLLGIRSNFKRFVETRDSFVVDKAGRVSLRHAM